MTIFPPTSNDIASNTLFAVIQGLQRAHVEGEKLPGAWVQLTCEEVAEIIEKLEYVFIQINPWDIELPNDIELPCDDATPSPSC